jgi:ABC-type glycerol-3-phosphate transport system permease component
MAAARGAIKEPLGDRLFAAAVYAILACAALVCLLPLANVLACSFSSSNAVSSYRVYLWPVEWNLRGYGEMFKLPELWSGYGNSLFYTLAGTAINLLMTTLAAYPLAHKHLDGRKQIMALYTFTMFFSGGLIPTYLVVRSLGMVNTRWAMLIPGAINVYNMIIMRSFFIDSVPDELKEAAEIDGANDFQQLLRIVLPLSMPVVAVLGLYYAIGHWNSYFNALIYLSDYQKYPLQLILREYLLSDAKIDELLGGGSSFSLYANRMSEVMGMREVLKYAMIVVATLPMALLYPFAQRYFIQGLMVGSIKG